MRYKILPEKCVKCGSCREICPAQAIAKGKIDQKKCLGCGACAQVCKAEAVVPGE